MKSLKEEVESFKYFDRDLNQLVDDPMVPGAGFEKNCEAGYAFAREKEVVNKLIGIENYLNIESEFYRMEYKKRHILSLSNFLKIASPSFMNEDDFNYYLKTYNELFELI